MHHSLWVTKNVYDVINIKSVLKFVNPLHVILKAGFEKRMLTLNRLVQLQSTRYFNNKYNKIGRHICL